MTETEQQQRDDAMRRSLDAHREEVTRLEAQLARIKGKVAVMEQALEAGE